MLIQSLILMMLLTTSSCAAPKPHEDEVCVDFTKYNDQYDLYEVIKCRCFIYDFDSNQSIGEKYDKDPAHCSMSPKPMRWDKLVRFFEEYKLWREDNKKILKKYSKRYRKRYHK